MKIPFVHHTMVVFLGIGLIILTVYLIASLRGRRRVRGNNPWGAATLEWTTTSPPPTENYKTQPVVEHGPYDFEELAPVRTYP